MEVPPTEELDPRAAALTEPEQLWDLFEQEQSRVHMALQESRDDILELSRRMASTLAGDGRIIGLGAGTSGRILALDMAEWGPTFSVDEHRRVTLLAGGEAAFSRAVEGAEDDGVAARRAIDQLELTGEDLVIGVSASGSALWVREGLAAARQRGASLVFITCHPRPIEIDVDQKDMLVISIDTGAEPVAGSTRLKAATATHQLLQRASSMCALRNGWIHRGRMVALRATNAKLRRRALTIVSELTDLSLSDAKEAISSCDGDLRLAIATSWLSGDRKKAKQGLKGVLGHLGRLEQQIRADGGVIPDPERLAGGRDRP